MDADARRTRASRPAVSNAKGGTFYRDVWLPDVGKDRKCLHTTDRAEAERLARALLAARLRNEHEAPSPRVLTLGTLWERFCHESQNFLDNLLRSRRDAAVRAATLIGYFGADFDVRMFSGDDQSAYTIARRAGGIRVSEEYTTVPVRLRTAESDLVVLHQMLNWAATVRVRGVSSTETRSRESGERESRTRDAPSRASNDSPPREPRCSDSA